VEERDTGMEQMKTKTKTKTYTFILKDEIPPQRDDGREMSGVSWEAEFTVPVSGPARDESMEESAVAESAAGASVVVGDSASTAALLGPDASPLPLRSSNARTSRPTPKTAVEPSLSDSNTSQRQQQQQVRERQEQQQSPDLCPALQSFSITISTSSSSSPPPLLNYAQAVSDPSRHTSQTLKFYLPFTSFKPTYRGRPAPDSKSLDLSNIQRMAIMMRSFFGQEGQVGEFGVGLGVVRAVSR